MDTITTPLLGIGLVTIAWRMLDDGDDSIYQGNIRCFEDDIVIKAAKEQF
jgi:hypothetical protein